MRSTFPPRNLYTCDGPAFLLSGDHAKTGNLRHRRFFPVVISPHDCSAAENILHHFKADAESAETLLDYCGKYQLSETGQVPFSTWPQGIKGKFVARVPPLD